MFASTRVALASKCAIFATTLEWRNYFLTDKGKASIEK
jgi:hypothetical protein